MNKKEYDVIIIGAGPAGVSCSLYAKRGNLNVCIISKRESNLLNADWVDNYYGFPGGISGEELFNNGLKQALKLGVDIFNDEVIEIDYDGNFGLKTVKNEFKCRALVLATGSKRNKSNIEKLDEYLGRGVSYCAICDGFFFKDKKVGVVGNKEYALSEARVLKNISDNVTIYTNGLEPTFDTNNLNEIKINKEKITGISGNEKLESIITDNNTESIDGLFVALGSLSTTDIALKLGIITEGTKIKINNKMETNIKGLYACGDATSGLQQISKAVYEGSVAGVEIIKYLKK